MADRADIRTTLGIYTHLTKVKKEAIEILNAHLVSKARPNGMAWNDRYWLDTENTVNSYFEGKKP